ncbi:hypothetical protein EDB85DRAFT_1886741 [Lactarius pseudohatsudake]|nr:hypothetical protein EDB85DRAFT_1886741 [Lactarius pseudohatsudake]
MCYPQIIILPTFFHVLPPISMLSHAMSPSSPHTAPHGVTLTLHLVALPTLCGVALNGLLVAMTLYSESIPPFRKSQKKFSAFCRHYSLWPPTVGASGEFRYVYRSSSLSDNVQPSSLTPQHSNPSPPAWPQRRRWGIVHVTHILRWSGGINGSMFNVSTTTLFISSSPFTSDLDGPSGCLDRSLHFPDPPFLVSAIFLTTLSACIAPFMEVSRLKALGVLLCAFPFAIAVARPSSLSDLRPTTVYRWVVSVASGTEAVQCNAKLPCCTIFAFKTTFDIQCATAIASHTSDPQSCKAIPKQYDNGL